MQRVIDISGRRFEFYKYVRKLNHWKLIAVVSIFIEVKALLSSPEKIIGAQYKIKRISQAVTIRLKRDLWTIIERNL